jgi:phosphoserine phosphatase RsbU/P
MGLSDEVGVAVAVQDLSEQRRLAALETEAVRLQEIEQLAHRLEAAQRIAGFGSWERTCWRGRWRTSR